MLNLMIGNIFKFWWKYTINNNCTKLAASLWAFLAFSLTMISSVATGKSAWILALIIGFATYLVSKILMGLTLCRDCHKYCKAKDICASIRQENKAKIEEKIKQQKLRRNEYLAKKIDELEKNYELMTKFKKDVKFVPRELKRLRDEIDLYKEMIKE